VASPWLGAKLVLLVLYIVLGSLALKRASDSGGRAPVPATPGALMVYLFMVSVALSHQPLGLACRGGWRMAA
jgi:uncharacterized membrane protein SirB2